ncbi:ABC transporter ATP-binding protein [Paenibacillus lentus]|uniref:ABC transporter ATP-binding protein n=1 Tax=Paenibacillus lentus TaxID=1338368 RepID=UPI0036528AC8
MQKFQRLRFIYVNLYRLMKLCWGICPRETAILVLIRLFQAFVPGIQLVLTKHLVDSVSEVFSNQNNVNQAFFYLGMQSLLLLVVQSVQLFERYNNSKMQFKIGFTVEEQIAAKTANISLRYFDSGSFYDTLQRASSGQSQRIIELLNGPIQIIQSAITMMTIIGVLLSSSYLTGIIVVLMAIPPFFINNHIGNMRRNLLFVLIPISRRIGYFLGLLKGRDTAKEVRVFQLQPFLLGKWEEQFNKQMTIQLSFERKSIWVQSLYDISNVAVTMINLGLLIWLGSRNGYSIGDYVAISQAYMTFQGVAMAISLSIAGIFENIKLLSDLFEFLNIKVEEEETETDTPETNFPSLNSNGILVKDLSFAYDNDDQLRLKNVSFQIKPGQRVAIVGDNGAGKSTLIKCLIGLYRNYTGHIYYENTDLKHMSAKLVFQHVGAVFQDYSKYDFSVKENIGVGDIDHLDDEEGIRAAAEKSGAHAFIEKLEKQYDTEVGSTFGGAVGLSGGQWQKVAISRSFFSKADLLVFDEPAASLDPFAEISLYQSLAKLSVGKIAIMISHRLSSCVDADLILVMRNGEIVEQGNHDELMDEGGYYSSMFLSQLSGYQKKVAVTK